MQEGLQRGEILEKFNSEKSVSAAQNLFLFDAMFLFGILSDRCKVELKFYDTVQ